MSTRRLRHYIRNPNPQIRQKSICDIHKSKTQLCDKSNRQPKNETRDTCSKDHRGKNSRYSSGKNQYLKYKDENNSISGTRFITLYDGIVTKIFLLRAIAHFWHKLMAVTNCTLKIEIRIVRYF